MKIQVIDSHTAGEPTRTVIAGLTSPRGALTTRDFLAKEADWLRTTLILEPRGFEAIVGAFLCEPEDGTCVTGVVFFNNTSYLNGCLHGTMGIVETLAHLGRITPGDHRIETPSGIVTANLAEDHTITVKNIPSYLAISDLSVDVPDYGTVTGDLAWGGNWFYLISDQGPSVTQKNIPALTQFTSAVQEALRDQNILAPDGDEIDHVETFGPSAENLTADSQNFVLCPGQAYDRSPCGTGTSAKLACLAASGHLKAGEPWIQASIIGTTFQGHFESIPDSNKIIPVIRGRAYITAETKVIINPDDPFCHGIPTS